MNYKKYQNARDAAWNILIQEQISELPINITGLCKQLGIRVKYYVPTDGNDGKSTIINGTPYIMVRKDMPIPRKRFTVAHELGHILLGHVGEYELVNREPGPSDNPVEREANVFASRLLAPACVLWGCGVKTAEDIQNIAGISKQAAEYRMERMELLYQRDKFLTSPLERKVYHQFEDFINQYRQRQEGR